MNTPKRATVTCPLCDRVIPPAQADRHHLVPRSKGGRRTESLHRVCHRQVHALLTEGELPGQYATVEALPQHPELQAFVASVKTKPEEPLAKVKNRYSARPDSPAGSDFPS